jgi:hypothetical protein
MDTVPEASGIVIEVRAWAAALLVSAKAHRTARKSRRNMNQISGEA